LKNRFSTERPDIILYTSGKSCNNEYGVFKP
jgi:hypothetical protein